MFTQFFSILMDLLHRGGPAMVVLMIMSMVSLTLLFERIWFWVRTQRRAKERVAMMARWLREGEREKLRGYLADARDVYAAGVRRFLDEPYSDALALEVIDTQRQRLDRFMATLSTMITAAPLVGLLGTVTGLISTFRFFGEKAMAVDPQSVGIGLSEALLNTAGGLIIAITVIFPYNAFRAQVNQTLTRLESLVAAAASGKISISTPDKPTA